METNTLTASVRISLKDGSVEIAGSEKFVQELLADKEKQIQNMIAKMQEAKETEEAKADDSLKLSRDRAQAIKDTIKKLLEQQEEVMRQTNL